MIRFFKSPQAATMILFPIIILVFWIRFFFKVTPVDEEHSLLLWDKMYSLFVQLPSWVNWIILYILVCIEAIYFNLMLNKHEVIYKNTFLPALMFALFISSTPLLMHVHPIHFVNILLIRIFDRLFTLFKNDFPVSALFDVGFLSGIAALLYFPALILFPLLLSSMAVLRTFRLKEWLIVSIGFFLPFFFLSTYMFWNRSLMAFWSGYLSHFHNIQPQFLIEKGKPILFLGIYTGLLLVLSLLKLRSNYRKNIIRARSYQQIFLIFLLFASGSILFLNKITVIHFAFLLVPVSLFCAYYFVSAKNRIRLYEYLLWVLVGLMIWNQV